MARSANFTPVKAGKSGWRLNVPAGYSESGKREQLFFPSREKANEAAKAYREKKDGFGKQAKSIRPSLAEAATRAEEILKPFGISLLQAAERVAAMEEKARASKPIGEALKEFMDFKAGGEKPIGKRMLKEYEIMEKTLNNAFGNRVLSTISGVEMVDAVKAATGTASTFNRMIENSKRFIRWAAHPLRNWADESETAYFEKETHKKAKIVVMKPEQAEALLRVAEKHYPDTVLAFVLMLFMGVRPEEVKRMSGDDITEDGVVIPDEDEVTGQEQKTGRRFIHMTDVVAEWLQHYPPSESIVPQNWKRKWDAARRLAGWAVKADFFKGTELYDTSNLPPWHQDILRHTAATICINMGKPMTVLIFEHGHTLGETTLKKHYLGRMTKREALGILSIGPKDKKLKPLTMKAV